MKTIDIKVRDVPLTGRKEDAPVCIPLQPLPLPSAWEELLLSRWESARSKSGKFPELTLANGMITLACRREDYEQFFHEEVEQKVEETNELYNRQQEDAAPNSVAETKEARRRAAEQREASRLRMREIAAFNELRRLREENWGGVPVSTPFS
jgi:hypothetical protein